MSPSPSVDEANPDSPSPSPSPPAGPATIPSSLFLPPKGPAAPLPPPSPSPSSSTGLKSSPPPADADEAPTWSSGYADNEATSSGPSESSDTPSTGSGGISVSKAGLRAALGRGLRTVTGVVNRLASTELEAQFDVWTADADDVADISDPAARIIWRKVPAEARTGDMVDLVVLGLAVLGYVAKSLDRRAAVRELLSAGETAMADPAAPAP